MPWLALVLWNACAAVPINVNTASESELLTLPGVGPKRAQAIVRMRGRRPFRRLKDLRRVRGLGRRRIEKLKGRVEFGDFANLKTTRRQRTVRPTLKVVTPPRPPTSCATGPPGRSKTPP